MLNRFYPTIAIYTVLVFRKSGKLLYLSAVTTPTPCTSARMVQILGRTASRDFAMGWPVLLKPVQVLRDATGA